MPEYNILLKSKVRVIKSLRARYTQGYFENIQNYSIS